MESLKFCSTNERHLRIDLQNLGYLLHLLKNFPRLLDQSSNFLRYQMNPRHLLHHQLFCFCFLWFQTDLKISTRYHNKSVTVLARTLTELVKELILQRKNLKYFKKVHPTYLTCFLMSFFLVLIQDSFRHFHRIKLNQRQSLKPMHGKP